ncbi:MAG TPA: hypothetical protein VFV50_15970 [Bdellovibrionales bacterium]|nr:hypothetical protein [Bdellovibrionales bacterium]
MKLTHALLLTLALFVMACGPTPAANVMSTSDDEAIAEITATVVTE